jgi:hypothetical protein
MTPSEAIWMYFNNCNRVKRCKDRICGKEVGTWAAVYELVDLCEI